ncbi:MAG: TlpA disulfide reductase family protein [Bacteroidales bacterium]|nr:TlpA disulfide reductase family protein [Bacteroidales bacterium]
MKKLFYLLIAVFLMASCSPEKNDSQYVITVQIDTLIDGNAYLQKREGGEWVRIDTAVIEEGTFSMEGVVDFPVMHYIFIENLKRNVPIFLDEGNIVVSVFNNDRNATTITGSVAHDQYTKYLDEIQTYEDRMRELYKEYRIVRDSGTAEERDSVEQSLDALYDEQQQFIKDYVFENNTDVVAPFIAYRNAYSWTVDELMKVVNNFDPALEASPDYAELVDRIEILKRVDIGQPLIDFTMKDTSGVDITLSEISKGKYMLVDFWASWCGPCRAENPNIVACYNDFHDRGFDILGVSFDNTRDKWIKAIHDDGLTWHHVSDLQYWNNAAGKLYGIRSIPSSIILDPDGIIVARNLRGDELREKLEELLPEKVE